MSELSLNRLGLWDGPPIQNFIFYFLVEHVLGSLYPGSCNAEVWCPDVLLVGDIAFSGLRGRPVMHREIPGQVYSRASDDGPLAQTWQNNTVFPN